MWEEFTQHTIALCVETTKLSFAPIVSGEGSADNGDQIGISGISVFNMHIQRIAPAEHPRISAGAIISFRNLISGTCRRHLSSVPPPSERQSSRGRGCTPVPACTCRICSRGG